MPDNHQHPPTDPNSLSGSHVAISQLLKHKTPTTLIAAIRQIDSGTPSSLKAALGRAFRTFLCSLADCSGPQRWGILPSVEPRLRKEAQSALDDFLLPASMDVWVPLIQDATLYPFLCATIANGIRTPAHRNALCGWLPPAERAKASKGKRGWATSATSPSTASSTAPFPPSSTATSSWILRYLLQAVTSQGNAPSTIAPSLGALAALCKDNLAACTSLRTDSSTATARQSTPGSEANSSPSGYIRSLLLMQRSSNPEVRIGANEL